MPHIPRAVCLTCNREMKPNKNGVNVLAHAGFGPYYVVQADVWECELCEQLVLLGFGNQPLAEHFHGPRFQNARERVEHEFVFRNERYSVDSLPELHQGQAVIRGAIVQLERRLDALRFKLEYADKHEKWLVQEVLDVDRDRG